MQASLERLRERRAELDGQGGFTLIELLIVIVILGILAAIVVFAVSNLTSSSAVASCKTDFRSVQTAVESYKNQMGLYPTGGGTQTTTGTGQSNTKTTGGTPDNTGLTDTDVATAAQFQAKAQPGGSLAPSGPAGVNAAALANGVTMAATGNNLGGELLTGSNVATATATTAPKDSTGATTANLTSPTASSDLTAGSVGPWLKNAPVNSGHYTIWVANDGTGQIAVLNNKGIAVQGTDATGTNGFYNDIAACNAIS